jgi:CzcA family heavy metal efflux pump
VSVPEWIQAHRRSLLFLMAILALGGLVSSFGLPVSLFPQVNFPRIEVSLDAGDRPAERMAVEVTYPVEEAIRAVPGVRHIRSITSRGSADLSVFFEWGLDMVAAKLQVESAINQVRTKLPPGTSVLVRRMDPTVFPVLAYSLTPNTHSLVELRDIALYQLRPFLSTVTGVARVGVQGGATAEYHVVVNPARLASYHLSLEEVANSVSASNVITAVGRLEDNYKLYLVVADTGFHNLQQIRQTVLRSGKDGLVRLEDIATVTQVTVPQWTRVTADGHDAVLFQVYQQPGGNTVRIARDIKKELASYRPHLPKGITIANWYDQSQLILASAGSVRDAMLIGVVFAVLILLIFLRNFRMTLIAAVIVPCVLGATILLLYVMHMSFNIMTLGGMAAAVGLIIDDMVVMEEHIIRRLRERAEHQHNRVMTAMREFFQPLSGSSTATIIIFTPMAFLSGVTGAFFKSLSLTMAASLVISFLMAWLAVPLLADHLLTAKDALREDAGPWTRRTLSAYENLMHLVLEQRVLVLLGIIPLLFLSWLAYQNLGSGFMPHMDEGGFVIDYRAPAGTSLAETDRLCRQVGLILRKVPDVQNYSRRTGLGLGAVGLTEANEGDFFVRLKPFPRRPIETVIDDVRSRIEHSVPGLHVEMAQLMEDLIGDLTAVPQPVEIMIFSDNGKLLQTLGPKVADAISKIPGVVDVNNGIVLAGDALDIRVNRDKASLEGVNPDQVTRILANHLSGVVTTQIQQGPQMVGVRVWTPAADRQTIRDLDNLNLRAADGHLFPVKRIARVTVITGQPQITRYDLKRMVAVTGRISGRDLGSVIRDVKAKLQQPGLLPATVYYRLGGLYEQQQIAFTGLVMVFTAAVLLVFFLLLFLYERFLSALAILFTTLLALCAIFIGLFITGTEINISSMMGMTMIVGIVTEVAIFYFSEYHDLPGHLDPSEALILAGKNRLRPIAMSTLAAMLALLPLALGLGQGAAMQQPLAIAIISGLAIQLPLVLIVLPVLLALFGRQKSL